MVILLELDVSRRKHERKERDRAFSANDIRYLPEYEAFAQLRKLFGKSRFVFAKMADHEPDYPPALKLIQNGKPNVFMNLVHSVENKAAVLNCKHSPSGDTPLILAARTGQVELLRYLASHRVNLEQSNKDEKRAIHEAAAGSHLDCLEFLISKEVDIDALKRGDWTPLMLACTKARKDIVVTLVNANANIILLNKDGWNCFHIAAREGHVDIMEFLLDHDPDIWDTKSNNERTPLHTAALHGRTEAVKMMVSRCGYKPDEKDSCGVTPLMDCLRGGYTDIADILMKDHKADLSVCDNVGKQAIHHAAQAGNLPSIKYLITKHRIDPKTLTATSGMTPAHLAAKESHKETLEFLLDAGGKVNAQDNRGWTALHLCSAAGHENCVSLLLNDYRADSSLKDAKGQLAKDLALKPSILELFK